jgi:hypothetical protein
MIRDKGRMGWQKAVGYGRRSLGETAVFRYKMIIGRRLRARPLPAQKTEVRWPRLVGQSGGLDKLGSGCCQAADLFISVVPYASSGVRPARVEWGRRVL